MGSSGPPAAAEDHCGATIVNDLKLDADLHCPGGGLSVGADGIRLNLNGHAIVGAGTGVGIAVIGHTDIEIAGGYIRNFATGILVTGSTDVVIKGNEFADNLEGIDLQSGSAGGTVKDNVFLNSATRAIMFRTNARDHDVKNNTFIHNRVAILLFGGVDNTLKHNLVRGSTLAGIRIAVAATRNLLKDNTVSANAAGIEFLVVASASATGNELKNNLIAGNTCGLKGPTSGNTLEHNVFETNVNDACF
jgi:parallel beta-helix repeat protein